MVRDAAKMTDHPIADFLAIFSMLTSSPLVAGFDLPYYYNCQRATIFHRRRRFSVLLYYSIYEMLLRVLIDNNNKK
jgi:hypothetical protein